MIAATDDGIFMDTNRSWSIDDKRLNFQFGCEIGWEIKGGKRDAAPEEPDVHRDQPAVLGLDGHARRAATSGRSGARRTAARASRSRSATPGHPAGARPLPRDPRRGPGMSDDDDDRAPADADRGRPVALADRVARARPCAGRRCRGRGHRPPGHGGADPLRHQLHPSERRVRGEPRPAAGRPRRPERVDLGRRPGRRREPRARDRRRPRGGPGPAARSRLAGPRAARRGARTSTTATTRPPRPRPTSAPGSVADFVDAAGGLETAGFCSTTRSTLAFANSAGQRLTGRGDARRARRDRPDADRRRAAAAQRRSARRSTARQVGDAGGRKARERERADRSRAGPLRGRARARLRREHPVVPARRTGSTARPVEEGRSFARVGETAVRPVDHAPRRRHRSGHGRASRSTSRARRSGRSTSSGTA